MSVPESDHERSHGINGLRPAAIWERRGDPNGVIKTSQSSAGIARASSIVLFVSDPSAAGHVERRLSVYPVRKLMVPDVAAFGAVAQAIGSVAVHIPDA